MLDWLESLPTDGAGCQALVVGDAMPRCCWLSAKRPAWKRNCRRLKPPWQGTEADDKTRNLIGQIAAARATLALTRYQAETMLAQSRRALEYLHPDNLSSAPTLTGRWGMPTCFRETVPRPAGPLPKPCSQPGSRGYLHHHPGDDRPGQRTGSRQPALPGGRDLPARPAVGR